MPFSELLYPKKSDGDAYELDVINDKSGVNSRAVSGGSGYINLELEFDRAIFVFDLFNIWSSGTEHSAIVEFYTISDVTQIEAKAIADGN